MRVGSDEDPGVPPERAGGSSSTLRHGVGPFASAEPARLVRAIATSGERDVNPDQAERLLALLERVALALEGRPGARRHRRSRPLRVPATAPVNAARDDVARHRARVALRRLGYTEPKGEPT